MVGQAINQAMINEQSNRQDPQERIARLMEEAKSRDEEKLRYARRLAEAFERLGTDDGNA